MSFEIALRESGRPVRVLAIETITEINLTMFEEYDLTACPTDEEIRSAIASDDHGDLFIRIRGHVRECRSCRSRLTQLGVWTQAETRFAPLISGDIPRPVLPATDHAQKSPGSPNRSEEFDFLAPAEAPGELGRLGGYRIIDVLGAGGMGVVFKGQDPSLARYVAIKVMKPVLTVHPFAKSRFLREARAAASINHENVIHIYQVGEDRGMPFLAMELLFGESIEKRLKRDGRFSLSEVLRIGHGIAAGLAAAHRRNVIHRDIKPANIILEPVDSVCASLPPSGHTTDPMLPIADCETINILHPSIETRVKIVDFGLARALDDETELTQTGVIAGTPKYMSPEQAEGHELDSRTDLFSLGAVLYHMLTGEGPFQGRSSSAILVAVVTQSHRSLRDVDPTIPEAVDQFFSKLLAKKADDRYRTAAEVLDAIVKLEQDIASKPQPVANDSLVVASTSKTAKSWNQNAPQPMASSRLVSLFALLILVGLIGGWFFNGKQPVVQQPNQNDPQANRVDEGNATLLIADQTKSMEVSHSQEVTPASTEDVPLSEWLKGREIVTVSKSGQGQFSSITAALGSLKDGQVIEVLDQGPYYENLIVERPARDVGLISRVGTQITAPVTERRGNRMVHDLVEFNEVRIHGFSFLESEQTKFDSGALLMLSGWGRLTIDDCDFLASVPKENSHWKYVLHTLTLGEASTLNVRNCWFGGRIYCSGAGGTSRYIHNYFDFYTSHQLAIADMRSSTSLTLHENIFTGAIWWRSESAAMKEFSIIRNSFLSDGGIMEVVEQIPPTSVRMNGNLWNAPIWIGSCDDVPEALKQIQKRWVREGNIYLAELPYALNLVVPSDQDRQFSKGEVEIDLSPDSVNYGRVIKIPGETTRDSQFPGALPFGDRTLAGDWFTALRDRKLKAQQFAIQSEESLRQALREFRLAATKLVVERGGVVAVVEAGQIKQIASVDAIPRQDFDLIRISLGWNRAISDADLQLFSTLNELKELDLNNTSITDAGLRHLEKLQSLEVLFLHGTRVTDEGVASLNLIPALRRLHLEATALTDRGIGALRPSPILLGLYVGKTGITAAAIPKIVERFPNLTELQLVDLPLSNADLSPLANLNGLNIVSLDRSGVNERQLDQFSMAPSIQILYLAELSLSDASIPTLLQFSRLKRLILVGTNLTVAGAKSIRASRPEMEVILDYHQFAAESCFGEGRKAVLDVELPSGQRQQVTSANQLPDETFRVVKIDLTNCQTLHFGNMSTFTWLKETKELVLRNSNLFPNEMGSLASFVNLERLDLSGTQITDQHSEVLLSMKQLRRLDVSRTGLSDQFVIRLRQALPDCHVVSATSSTP